ncbi:MAG: alpha/beta hydrolase family esterase [Fimbriimonadaceae bacterium]
MSRYAALMVAVWAVGACHAVAVPTEDVKPGRHARTLAIGEDERTYNLRVPPSYDGTKPLPLVVLLHGYTGSADIVEAYTGFAAKADAEGFFLVTPNGLGRPQGWNMGFFRLGRPGADDHTFLTRMIEEVEKEVKVDPDRIYMTGHSNGGMMSLDMGSRLAGKLAAIASVAGTIGVHTAEGQRRIGAPKAPISVLMIHGDADPLVRYDDEQTGLRVTSAPNGVRFWASELGGKTTPKKSELLDGAVIVDSFPDAKAGVEIVLVTLKNGDHDWPRPPKTPFVATDYIWEFFKRNPRRPATE